MDDQIKREAGIHGEMWDHVHGGYFSNPAVAEFMLKAIGPAIMDIQPQTVFDLGGGNGFLLDLIRQRGWLPDHALVNLETSPEQLRQASHAGIHNEPGTVEDFSRERFAHYPSPWLLVMRSVLHYFGQAGLDGVLEHLHRQTQPGELFVHQTASFANAADADCLNLVYRMMRTPKWYPTVENLTFRLAAAGWEVLSVHPAPALKLTAEELAARYSLSAADVAEIIRAVTSGPEPPEQAWQSDQHTFSAYLHFHIYTCRG